MSRLAAQSLGATAALVVSPYYNKPDQRMLEAHYRTIADVGLPVVVYNVPGRTACDMLDETTERLSRIPNIVGIKDSSGDLQLTAQYVRVAPDDFSVLMGRDTLILAGLLYGASGSIAVDGLNNYIANTGMRIVGAGVSTCAPVIVR